MFKSIHKSLQKAHWSIVGKTNIEKIPQWLKSIHNNIIKPVHFAIAGIFGGKKKPEGITGDGGSTMSQFPLGNQRLPQIGVQGMGPRRVSSFVAGAYDNASSNQDLELLRNSMASFGTDNDGVSTGNIGHSSTDTITLLAASTTILD